MTDSPGVAPGAGRLSTLSCSFCTKDKDSVAKLVAGPGVYICNECINLCNEILGMDPMPQTHTQIHVWHEQSDDELLASVARVQAAAPQLDAAMHDYVDLLRARGVSWTRIGAALGVSKQAAWERFSGED
jgi:hypothetical protein